MCCVCNQLLTLRAGRVTIDILPDDVLLHIFLADGQGHHMFPRMPLRDSHRVGRLPWKWHRLVHVCRRWRSIIFASPNFLDLRLVCGPRTGLRFVDNWPPLPFITITNAFDGEVPDDYDFNAVIMYPNRVREICFVDHGRKRSLLQRLATTTWMQEQFPAMTHLTLVRSIDHQVDFSSTAPILPDEFLGRTAPRLQSLELTFIIFPALQNLLLSSTHLVRLTLQDIPEAWYLSPEVIATALAMLVNLKRLIITFLSPVSRPDRKSRNPPPPTPTVLPALTQYEFSGASDYLEDFVARIDAPSLNSTYITFFPPLTSYLPRLAQFMGRITRFQELKVACMRFIYEDVFVEFLPPTTTKIPRAKPALDELSMSCKLMVLEWRLLSESLLAHVISSFFPSIYMVEHLHLGYSPQYLPPFVQLREVEGYAAEDVLWLDIFRPFTMLKNLHLSKPLASKIAPALQALVGKRTTEVLPNLQTLFLIDIQWQPSSDIPEGIQNFVAARQLSGHPITVSS